MSKPTLILSHRSRRFIAKMVVFCTPFLFVSCSYRAVTMTEGDAGPIAISIPLIRADDQGYLRDSLAQELSSSGRYTYSSSSNSRYELRITTKLDVTEQIGYVWDRNPQTNQRFNILYPNEGRRLATLQASVYDTHKKKTVVAPFTITDHVDYDFVNPTAERNIIFTDLQGQRQTSLQYSYGQLDSEEGSRLESYQPLYQIMAKKVVNTLLRRRIAP